MHTDTLYRIALTQVPFVGPVVAKNLISYCGSAEKVFTSSKSLLRKIPGIGDKIAGEIWQFKDFTKAEEELKFIEEQKIDVLFYMDEQYPSRLKIWPDAPLLLFSKGKINLNAEKVIAIVGTRHASQRAKEWTDQLVNDLQSYNCLILSGFAFGIDIAAHKSALKYNLPTAAVMGSGFRYIYPYQHRSVAKQMVETGMILTEYTGDVLPDKQNFPSRNRIVAAMCDALVVVETKIKGGSMITADLAEQYHKDIFAVPGAPGEVLSEGCNQLIKSNKAALIENAADLIYQMSWDVKFKLVVKQPSLFVNLTDVEEKVYQYLKTGGKAGVDDILIALEMTQHALNTTLLELEMKDVVRSLPGKYYELK